MRSFGCGGVRRLPDESFGCCLMSGGEKTARPRTFRGTRERRPGCEELGPATEGLGGAVPRAWPWKVRVRDIVTGPDLAHCPTIDEIGVGAKSLRRHTHIKLDKDAGVLAETLLDRANQRAHRAGASG